MMSLLEKWEELTQLDAARQDVGMTLKTMLERAERTEHDLRIEIERMKAYEEQLCSQRANLETRCKGLQERADTAPFVMVLVDGDNTQFLDDFVKAGFDGGHQAAQLFKQQLEDYLREFLGFESHWKVIVHIYANLHGLLDTYQKAQVVSDIAVARKFVTGFNRELSFFEFIDAGNDKEAADSKIKCYLKHYHETANCRHLVLAGSGDRGYVGYLRQFSGRTPGISLIEAVPFEPSFRSLADHFKTKTFPEVFKATKLEAATPEMPAQVTHGSYATITSASHLSSPYPGPPTAVMALAMPSSRSVEPSSHILKYNRFGERLDETLPFAEKSTFERMKTISEKPCVRFYLTSCGFGGKCKYSHEEQYNAEELKAIKRLARSSPCARGKHCGDVNCVASHYCIYNGRCEYGDCRFSAEMHHVDKTVAEVRRI